MVDIDALRGVLFRIGSKGPNRPLAEIERKYFYSIPLVIVVSLISTVFEGASIGLMIPLLSLMMPGMEGLGSAGETSSEIMHVLHWVVERAEAFWPGNALLAIGIFILGLILFKGIVLTYGWLMIAKIDGHAHADIRNSIARKFLRAPYSLFLTEEHSRLVNVLSNDSWRAGEAIQAIYGVVGGMAASLILGLIAVFTNWKLFMVIVAGALLARGLQQLLSNRIKKLSDLVTEANRDLGEKMLLTIDLARIVRLFGQQQHTYDAYAKASDKVRQTVYDSEKLSSSFGPVMEFIQAGLFILVLILARYMGMTVPEIIAFLALQYRLQPQILGVTQGILDLSALGGSIREVEWILGEKDDAPSDPAVTLTAIDRPIVVRQLSYAYPEEERFVLTDVDFTLRPGIATALIGRSGAGKSTLINLLTRLIEPSNGAIMLGDTPISYFNGDAWRSRIALAGQDVDLVDGTVTDNIRYGCPGATQADVEEAARIADAHDFIMAMGGYAAKVGSYGFNLSGGQRQRVSLARALVRRPDLLILDEATNAVDGLSEHTIITLLHEHRRFGTAIVISHRRSTLNACEDGIVIESGRIAEAGPLRSLRFYHEMEKWPAGLEPTEGM